MAIEKGSIPEFLLRDIKTNRWFSEDGRTWIFACTTVKSFAELQTLQSQLESGQKLGFNFGGEWWVPQAT